MVTTATQKPPLAIKRARGGYSIVDRNGKRISWHRTIKAALEARKVLETAFEENE